MRTTILMLAMLIGLGFTGSGERENSSVETHFVGAANMIADDIDGGEGSLSSDEQIDHALLQLKSMSQDTGDDELLLIVCAIQISRHYGTQSDLSKRCTKWGVKTLDKVEKESRKISREKN